jgi:hypothetical protein
MTALGRGTSESMDALPGSAGRVSQYLITPDQASILAKINHVLEEPTKDWQAEPLADLHEAGAIGQWLIKVVAEVPAVRQIQAGKFNELPFGANTLEEHDEVEPEEDDRVDRGSTALGVAFGNPGADEAEVERCIEVTVEVIRWDEPFERDDGRPIEIAGFGRTKHGSTSAAGTTNRVAYPNLLQPTFFTAPRRL